MKERWWLSFSDEINLGCIIVELPKGGGFIAAVLKTKKLKINPGGEVKGWKMSIDDESDQEVKQFGLHRLITRDELISAGYEVKRS